MRNLFLALILANLLFLAWHVWIDPSQPASPVSGPDDLAVFSAKPGQVSPGLLGNQPGGNCLQMGPLPSDAAAQQARERLASRGVDAIPVARETQQWLGHWVQIVGFSSAAAAETAHQRLISGGLADAYLVQDGAEPMISLGVFRDQSRAERAVETARTLGFDAVMRDRYRPAVEQWLLIRSRSGQALGAADLSMAGDRIMRTENAACGADSAVSAD